VAVFEQPANRRLIERAEAGDADGHA
jgi:hypothetical protein